jgi:hypothetical protein
MEERRAWGMSILEDIQKKGYKEREGDLISEVEKLQNKNNFLIKEIEVIKMINTKLANRPSGSVFDCRIILSF